MRPLIEKVHNLENKYQHDGERPSLTNVPEEELIEMRESLNIKRKNRRFEIALWNFPEERKQIIKLHDQENSQMQIAKQLGYSLTTVRRVIHEHERGEDE